MTPSLLALVGIAIGFGAYMYTTRIAPQRKMCRFGFSPSRHLVHMDSVDGWNWEGLLGIVERMINRGERMK